MYGLTIILYVIAGTIIGSILCIVPALHIYNVAGIAIMIWMGAREIIPYYCIAPFFISLVVAFAFMNNIPMTFLNAADESAGASVLPSTDMVMRGRGVDATLLSGVGSLMGAFFLFALYPFFWFIWPYFAKIMGPHLHWVLGLIVAHYLMSEWPKGAGRGDTAWQKFREAWRNCFAGLLTFTLAASFGLIYTSKSILPAELSFQNIMPVFVGFFAIPSIVQNIISSDFRMPEQYDSKNFNADKYDYAYGLLPGFVGGLIAAYLPAVTAGIGAMLAGHITNHRNLDRTEFRDPDSPDILVSVHTPDLYYRQERIFLIAGGVIKVMYYVGAFLLLFVITELTPNGVGRGGLTFILKPVFSPERGDYFIMISTILLSSCIAFLLLTYVTPLVARHIHKLDLVKMYWGAMVMILLIVYFMGGGIMGLAVTAVTSCIGMIPVFFGCRRSHCMAVLLVPILLNMAGYGDRIVMFLGLD
jgi:putative membrane protein